MMARSNSSRSTLRLFCCVASFLALVGTARADVAAPPPPRAHGSTFDFALLGDPQLGYGSGAEWGDFSRLRKVAAVLNRYDVAATLVAGDLVQDRTWLQNWLFRRARSELSGRVVLAAGNHDVVDARSLADFRAAYGPDYYHFVVQGSAFVVLDSETARDRRIAAAEYDEQWRFIERSLAEHSRLGREHVFLLMHRPPFVDDEHEPDSDANWPAAARQRLLALARLHGVRWIFAGHLHRMKRTRTSDGLEVLVLPGSARSFDESDIGFQLVHVAGAVVTSRWVTVASAPARPFGVRGLREWTPRLFDFSVRHWLITCAYAWTGWLALRRARRSPPAPQRGLGAWHVVAGVLFGFAINAQLDLDELLRECGRIAAKLAGVHEVRHLVTGTGLSLLVGSAVVFLSRSRGRADLDLRTRLALAALLVPLSWFCLSAISHHYIGMVLSEDAWDLASIAALATIAFCSRPRTLAQS